jgi:hypothetical protein
LVSSTEEALDGINESVEYKNYERRTEAKYKWKHEHDRLNRNGSLALNMGYWGLREPFLDGLTKKKTN